MDKCRKILSDCFEEKNWGGPELRKVEMILEGEITDEITKDLVSKLFEDLETNPPSGKLGEARDEN